MTGLIALPSIPWGRLGIAVGILAVAFTSAGWFIEARRADKLDSQVTSYRVALGQARAEAGRLKAEGIRIANEEKARHEKEVARIRADADGLRLRGAGKGVCYAPASASPGSGGSNPGTGNPVDQVHPGERVELIGLPPAPTATLAENHDLGWERVRAWERWYAELVKAWGAKPD